MSKKDKKYREHWYSGITEAVQMYVPGNKQYHTIAARRARIGTLFILCYAVWGSKNVNTTIKID